MAEVFCCGENAHEQLHNVKAAVHRRDLSLPASAEGGIDGLGLAAFYPHPLYYEPPPANAYLHDVALLKLSSHVPASIA